MKKLLILLFSVMSLLSCDDDSKEQPEIKNDADISISSEVLTFLNDGNPVTTINSVAITSSGDWRMIGDKTWCVPSVSKLYSMWKGMNRRNPEAQLLHSFAAISLPNCLSVKAKRIISLLNRRNLMSARRGKGCLSDLKPIRN